MIRFLLVVLALLGILLAGFAGMYGTGSRADLIYVNPSGVHTLDPARMSWTQDFRLALNLWEGLTTWDAQTLTPIPAAGELAEVSSDGLVYTFVIRPDARWSDGDPVSAADFVRGWRRSIEPGTAGDYVFFFTDHIVGVREYVDWRNSNIAALSAMRKLSRGTIPNAAELQALDEQWEQPAEIEGVDLTGPYFRAEQLADKDLDWSAQIEAHCARHSSQLDERFRAIGIEAVDDRTLRVQLKSACAYFLDLTSTPAFLPCHQSVEELRLGFGDPRITAEGLVVYDPQWTKPDYITGTYQGLVTNGPYHVARWRFRQGVRMEVNPYYRRAGAMQCRSVEMLEHPNVSASLMAYEAGDVDFLTDMTVPYAHELARQARDGTRGDFRLSTVLATYFLNFNCVSREVDGVANPFLDARVRRAFTMATDRATLVGQVLARGDRTAHSIVPPNSIPGYASPRGLQFDIEAARTLLDEAGYASRSLFPAVQILCTFNDERLMQALARMWRKTLGIRVELRVQESKTLAADKAAGRYMIARGNWYADYTDPTTFLNCYLTGDGNNDTGYSEAEFDARMQLARKTVDPEARARLLAEAEALLIQRDCPILPILHYSQLLAIKPHVRGIHPNARLWFPFQHVTFER